MPTEPNKPEGRSVWVSVAMTLLAIVIAKACVASMKPERPRGAYSGGR